MFSICNVKLLKILLSILTHIAQHYIIHVKQCEVHTYELLLLCTSIIRIISVYTTPTKMIHHNINTIYNTQVHNIQYNIKYMISEKIILLLIHPFY